MCRDFVMTIDVELWEHSTGDLFTDILWPSNEGLGLAHEHNGGAGKGPEAKPTGSVCLPNTKNTTARKLSTHP